MPPGTLDEPAINVTAFKAQCLALIDAVAEGKASRVALTRHGRAVAALVPYNPKRVMCRSLPADSAAVAALSPDTSWWPGSFDGSVPPRGSIFLTRLKAGQRRFTKKASCCRAAGRNRGSALKLCEASLSLLQLCETIGQCGGTGPAHALRSDRDRVPGPWKTRTIDDLID